MCPAARGRGTPLSLSKDINSAAGQLQNRFFILPYQKNGSRYLNAFDIIAAPSVKEGLPYFLLEAALAKKAIVSTTVGGIPEIIESERSGLLVEPKNVTHLVWALERLIKEPSLRKTLAENAYHFASKNFPLAKMIDRTAKLYEELQR